MKFYDGYEGEILVDGIDIRNLDTGHFRSKIGYVQQEPMMFSDTIYNNIAYGVPGRARRAGHQRRRRRQRARIHRAAADAYDSMLGERGVGLSGGEKQRISIARAVLMNPSILIFDEATAAVDSETENLIQEAIERLISGRDDADDRAPPVHTAEGEQDHRRRSGAHHRMRLARRADGAGRQVPPAHRDSVDVRKAAQEQRGREV